GLARDVEERFGRRLPEARAALAAAPAPAAFAPFDALFAPAFAHTAECVALFGGFPAAAPAERIPRILAALHHHAQAQEHFYPIRRVLPPLREYWSSAHETDGEPARSPLVRVSAGGHPG